MNFKRLKSNLSTAIAAFSFGFLLFACNNENESVNSSTEVDKDSLNKAPSSTNATAAKKKGRASSKVTAEDMSAKMEVDKMGYYNRTEVAPQYAGGQTSLDEYINNNIEYPQEAIDNNVEGVVNVQFAIDEKGNISNVSTIGNKLGYGLEEQAIKVVSNMPKWSPGQVKGKNVKTWRTLPINYQLES
jgi:TonB family protein